LLSRFRTLLSFLGISMSSGRRPRWIEPGIGKSERDETYPGDRSREPSRAEWSILNDPREQRRVRNRLIALALALPIAQLLRLLFR
jgi:hypothetical protein